MCGLSGAMGDLTTKEERAVKTLLIWSQVRGMDSTGIGAVNRTLVGGEREIKVAKETGTPNFLMDMKAFDKVFYGTNMVYIGHNRLKTTGEINRKCAHPFLIENILGAHNGTIDHQNKNRMENGGQFRTDSEAIFNNINVHGIQDTIGRIDKSEAYALTWYDKRDNTLNFIRNKERPLWYIYSNDRRCLFWASEYEILVAAVSREGIDLKKEKAYVVNEDHHISWVIPLGIMEKLPEPTQHKYENHKTIVTPYSHPNSAFWKGNQAGQQGKKYGDSMFDKQDWNYNDWVQGGCCTLPQDKSGNQLADNIAKGIAILDAEEAETMKNALVVTNVKETKVMTAVDFDRKRRLDKLLLIQAMESKAPEYKSNSIVAYMDYHSGKWTIYIWNPTRGEWDTHISNDAPLDLPYNILDIEARHCFLHKGHGKKRKTYYKGYDGALLDQAHFNQVMQDGCMVCARTPEWGNSVTFVDKGFAFMCEWCSKVPGLVESTIKERKKVA